MKLDVDVVRGGVDAADRLVAGLDVEAGQVDRAHDECYPRPEPRNARSAAGVGAGRRGALDRRRQGGRLERRAVEQVALARLDVVEPGSRSRSSRRMSAPATITGARSGSSAAHVPAVVERKRGEAVEQTGGRRGRDAVALDAVAVVLLEPEVESRPAWSPFPRRRSRPRARAEAAAWPRTCSAQASSSSRVGGSERRKRSVSRTQPRSSADVEAVAGDELGRAAADVDDERARRPTLRSEVAPRKTSFASSSPVSSRVVKP